MPWRELFPDDASFKRALRQWYAGMALPAVIASAFANHISFPSTVALHKTVASTAIAVADALIAAEEGK